MATYAIGDIQGCFDALLQLLDKIAFNPKNDTLWFTGDLVNRGSQSLETVRFIKALGPKAIMVLGNHDIAMLTIARGAEPFESDHHSFSDILEAEDREELLSWLEHQPLLHYDKTLGYLLVHAGLYPWWSLEQALANAKEVERVLQSNQKMGFYQNHYGDTPERWQDNLTGFDRLRFIVNAFTRMRVCSVDGRLDLKAKGSIKNLPEGCHPWYELWDKEKNQETKNPNPNVPKFKILFGHWSALQGICPVPGIFALDTGCVWGDGLTALRLEDELRFKIDCK